MKKHESNKKHLKLAMKTAAISKYFYTTRGELKKRRDCTLGVAWKNLLKTLLVKNFDSCFKFETIMTENNFIGKVW